MHSGTARALFLRLLAALRPPQLTKTRKDHAQKRFSMAGWRGFRRGCAQLICRARACGPQLVISMESLSGLMPGHGLFAGARAGAVFSHSGSRWQRFWCRTAPRLWARSTRVPVGHTRSNDDWLRVGAMGHLLRSSRLTDGFRGVPPPLANLPTLGGSSPRPDRRCHCPRPRETAAREAYTLCRHWARGGPRGPRPVLGPNGCAGKRAHQSWPLPARQLSASPLICDPHS